jgi:hippurate hydrolase
MAIPAGIADLEDEMIALRHRIHAHPELAYEEFATAGLVAERLQEWGYTVTRGLGQTGVVGQLKVGDGTKRLGLRADMDALPIHEQTGLPYASTIPGKMHACGHDGHTAMLLAAAQHLAKHRDFDGTVYLLFQPAEEGGGGAREMIKDGLFTEFPMDAVFGMHNWPGIAVGQLAVCPGPCMASSNEFFITIKGRGSHAALPHLSIDPVPIACQMVQAFQTIVTRNKKPTDTGVISVTTIHTGEATNVIPDSCIIEGTVRTFTLPVLDMIEQRMKEIAKHTAAAFGATVEFRFHRNYPPTVNHDAEAEFVAGVMRDTVGPENTLAFEPSMTAEDFSYFLLEKPGAYFVIGNGDGRHRLAYSGGDDGGDAQETHNLGPCTLHNPHYDFNDDLIPLGGTLWIRLVDKWFAERA